MIETIQSWKRLKKTHRQFIKYLIVGGTTALCELVLFTFLLRGLHLSIIFSNIFAVVGATILNFFLNRTWSFQSNTELGSSIVLYIALVCFNMGVSTYAIHFMVKLGYLDILAKLMTMAAITLWNFVLYRKLIF